MRDAWPPLDAALVFVTRCRAPFRTHCRRLWALPHRTLLWFGLSCVCPCISWLSLPRLPRITIAYPPYRAVCRIVVAQHCCCFTADTMMAASLRSGTLWQGRCTSTLATSSQGARTCTFYVLSFSSSFIFSFVWSRDVCRSLCRPIHASCTVYVALHGPRGPLVNTLEPPTPIHLLTRPLLADKVVQTTLSLQQPDGTFAYVGFMCMKPAPLMPYCHTTPLCNCGVVLAAVEIALSTGGDSCMCCCGRRCECGQEHGCG